MELLSSSGGGDGSRVPLSSSAVTLNLDSALTGEPPLAFLADASVWFEEQQLRRPCDVIVSDCPPETSHLVQPGSHCWPTEPGEGGGPILNSFGEPQQPLTYIQLTNKTTIPTRQSLGMGRAGGAEADRLEVARIMEQLKKGWDGTAVPNSEDPTSFPFLSRPPDPDSGDSNDINGWTGNLNEGISCRFENTTLTVDLCPLFTEELWENVRETVHGSDDTIPVQLKFPSGPVTLFLPLNQLWTAPPPAPLAPTPPTAALPQGHPQEIGEEGMQILITEENEITDEDGEKKWQCNLCPGKIYTSRANLQCHFLSHTNSRPYNCHLCPKTFRQIGHLQTHMRLHTGERKFSCQICQKRFIQKHHLLRHARHCQPTQPSTSADSVKGSDVYEKEKPTEEEHEQTNDSDKSDNPDDEGERKTNCPQCLKPVFKLKRHLRMVHSEARPFICSECGAEFKLAQHWKTHMAVHSQSKTQHCPYCNASFKLVPHLKRHISSCHPGQSGIVPNPFSCPQCPKTFNRKDTLNIHVLSHSNQNKLSCDICGKQFRVCARLQYHKSTVHGPQAQPMLNCVTCNLTFSRYSNLKRHQRTSCQRSSLT